MNTDPGTDNNPITHPQDSAKFDGMELTGDEATQVALPLDGSDPAEPEPKADDTPASAADDTPAAAAKNPEPAPQPAAPAPLFAEEPKADRDYAAEKAALKKAYDDGDITTEEFVDKSGELTIAHANYTAQMTLYQAEQRRAAEQAATAKAAADEAWNAAALQFEADNAAFMNNAIRAKAMDDAIKDIDRKTGGKLAPAELLKQAAEQAFDAFGWKPQAADSNGVAKAVTQRAPDTRALPTNLGGAPAAGSEDRGNAGFAALDAMDIDQLEDALARMPAAQREAYLSDAPGARSTGRE